ncbi:hypothetical protein ACQEVB_20965 [Pseudonocardia sp. CA-107938]|uniref:hypothetical protein n=1 Tax=Pseudonocardia sp. CA-107938 TaxID=3240021 RepID=UPI003D8FC044
MSTHALVTFIASQPGAAERLLAVHVDDGTGHCLVCSAGPQAGRLVWPCPLHDVAQAARAIAGRS